MPHFLISRLWAALQAEKWATPDDIRQNYEHGKLADAFNWALGFFMPPAFLENKDLPLVLALKNNELSFYYLQGCKLAGFDKHTQKPLLHTLIFTSTRDY